MTLGSRARRTASGFSLLAIIAMAGCHAMPLAGVAPSPNRPKSTLALAGRAALMPATVAMDPPSEMSSFEPVGAPAESITPAEIPPEPTKLVPTPLLDAALLRTQAVEPSPFGVVVNVESPPIAPSPPPALIQLPDADPPKREPVAVALASSPPAPSAKAEPEPAKEPEPARPEDLWRDGVRKLGSLARAKLDQSGGTTTPWNLRSRILSWLAEPDIDPELGHRDTDGVRAVLRALDEPSVESTRRGEEVRTAVLVLEDKAPLEIVDFRLCSKVERFGDFEPFEPPVRKAGQKVVLYCEVDGLRFEQTAAGFRTRISAQLEILPEGGGPPILTRSLGTAEETCRRRRRDYYIAYMLTLPKSIAPGDYRIRVTQKDLTTDRSASREVAFGIAKD